MEEEKIATLLANLFPPIEGETLNIFIKKNKFVVVNFSFNENRIRRYYGEISRSKIKFWGESKFKLSVNIKYIKGKRISPTKMGLIDGYSVWTTNVSSPLILPYEKILKA